MCYSALFDGINDWVGPLGGPPQAKTPHLDRCCKDGAGMFKKAVCAAPICGSSRSPVLSGFLPSSTGVYGNSTNMFYADLRGNHRIYDGRYSDIIYNGGEELYDHKKDIMEWTNLARDPEYSSIEKRLRTYLPATGAPDAPSNRRSR